MGRSLLVADKEKTLAGLGSPGNVAVSDINRLLRSLISGESLGIQGLVAEEEELLAGDQVPFKTALA
jgi:hypothetical protein